MRRLWFRSFAIHRAVWLGPNKWSCRPRLVCPYFGTETYAVQASNEAGIKAGIYSKQVTCVECLQLCCTNCHFYLLVQFCATKILKWFVLFWLFLQAHWNGKFGHSYMNLSFCQKFTTALCNNVKRAQLRKQTWVRYVPQMYLNRLASIGDYCK